MVAMMRCQMKQRRTYSPEFKVSAASLVLDQGYSHVNACRSVGVAESVLRRWVQQFAKTFCKTHQPPIALF